MQEYAGICRDRKGNGDVSADFEKRFKEKKDNESDSVHFYCSGSDFYCGKCQQYGNRYDSAGHVF